MQIGTRRVACALVVGLTAGAASLGLRADAQQSEIAEIQLQLANELFAEGRYPEALDAYQRARQRGDTRRQSRRPRAGLIVSALRIAEFDLARTQAEAHVKASPRDAEAIALYADALWSSGLFEEAEAALRGGASRSTASSRAATTAWPAPSPRAASCRRRMEEAQAALRLSPRDLEIHHTIGTIYERMHNFEEAAGAFSNYVNLLPNKDRSEKADWSRSEIKFLRSFGQRVPFELDPGADDQTYTIDFRLVNDKVIVRAKVNEGSFQDFVVDTGAENTILSGPTAQRLGVTPITYTLSAGVGDVGLRGLQLARINTLELGPLKLRNVPCLIKDPPLRNLPVKESESLSPLALGFSMIIDYKTQKITFGKQLAPEHVRFRAAAAHAPPGDGPRHGRRHAAGQLRRRHGRRGDLDQPGDRVEPESAGADAADRAAGVRIVGLGQGRVPDAGRRSELRSPSATRTSRWSC